MDSDVCRPPSEGAGNWVRSGRRRSGFVVELRISSAAANRPEAENPLIQTSYCQDKGDLDLQGVVYLFYDVPSRVGRDRWNLV